ncbi:MAG: substrate-binding domain-containing protein [Cyanobacteria bacterium J06627_8]
MIKSVVCSIVLIGAVGFLQGCTSNSVSENVGDASLALEEDATLSFGGSSEAYEVLEKLAEAFNQTVDGAVDYEFFPPSQTSGGLEGVASQVFDIGGVSRVISVEEVGNTLTYQQLIQVPMVPIANNSVTGVTNISADQLRAIYGGAITNWLELGGPDADIVLLDFVEDENEKIILRQAYLGEDFDITMDAIVFPEDDELLETAASTAFSFAVVPLEDDIENLPVNVLSLDNLAPSDENIRAGDYKMIIDLGMVMQKEPSPAAQLFFEFISSPAGQAVLFEESSIEDQGHLFAHSE